MNINYLYSVITLYLKRENTNKTNLLIEKINQEQIRFSFNMNKDAMEATSLVFPLTKVTDSMEEILKLYKGDLLVIDEKYTNLNNNVQYEVLFNTGRRISFNNFTLLEINDLRNKIFGIKINKEEIRIKFIDEQPLPKKDLKLQESGFVNYTTVILMIICFLGVFFIILWVLKSVIK